MAGQDKANETYERACGLIDQSRSGLKEALRTLRALLPQIRDPRSRGLINQRIWECERALGNTRKFFSQTGQDAWLEANLFKGRRGGRFVEIGGFDGITGSTTLFFEMMRGWSGLLLEPAPAYFAEAESLRRCTCLRLAVAEAEGEAEFLDIEAGMTQMSGLVQSYDPKLRAAVEADPRHKGTVIRVPTRPLAAVLDDHGMDRIDLVSLDVEGGEMAVLQGFPFERFRITAWTIENNSADTEIPLFMQSKGYVLAEVLGVDNVYVEAEAWRAR
jgi:FkbM family methyltransferase